MATTDAMTVLELRRLVCHQLERAHAELTDDRKDAHEAVHSARKRFKKIRAVLRLLRGELGERYACESAWYRDQGRELARVRDASTLIEAIDALTERFPEAIRRTAAADIRPRLATGRAAIVAEIGDLSDALRGLAEKLGEARARLQTWPACRMDFEAISPWIRKSYAKGRRALRETGGAPTAANFHELRKRVKDYWYHCKVLSPCLTCSVKPPRRTLAKLAEALGEDHDLAVLREHLSRTADDLGGIERLASLFALIDTRQAELRGAAAELGEEVYAEKPRAYLERLGKCWKKESNDH
jgi:CHAD domain-containing protein